MMLATLLLFAVQTIHYHGELPDAEHAWCVHDLNRPNPAKVSAEAGRVPSDATVLFDGTAESVAANWCDKDGGPTKWKAEDGRFVCVPGSGYAFTKERFGDCQLHIEWMAPADEPGVGQGRGNSGVFLGNRYELQILESFGTDPRDMKNPNYADGQAGALYGQHPPLVNPARPEGIWQSYDVVYHPALWENGRRVRPATVTAFFNGVLVHDQWEIDGPTDWVVRSKPTELPYEGPLALQDHGHPVPFRNIWIRKIPSRWDDKAHGGCAVNPVEVAKQRVRNGAKKFSEVQDGVYDFVNAERAMEAVAYDPDGGYEGKMQAVCDGFAEVLYTKDAAWIADPDHRDDVLCIRRLCRLMIARGWMKPGQRLVSACNHLIAMREHDPRCVFSLYIIDGAKQSGIPLAEAIDRVKKCGIKSVDVCVDEVAPAQQMCAAGMTVASVYGDVRFLDPDNGEKTGAELLAAAQALESPRVMVLPQAFPEGADDKGCMARTIDGLRKLVEKAKLMGVTVTVENFGNPRSPCARIRHIKEMLDGVPDLKFTLDVGNFFSIGEGDDPMVALNMFRDRIVHCHVKDYRENMPGVYCPLGKGCIPVGKIVKDMIENGYSGSFTIEESQAPDYLKAVEDAERVLSSYLKQDL